MSQQTVDVIAIGNAIVDVLYQCEEDFLARFGLAKGSMQLVDEVRAQQIYRAMIAPDEVSGGSAANTAAGIAMLGGKAAFVGKVRDDHLGDVFNNDIRACGVEFTSAPATHGPATARCLIAVTPDGERTMNTYIGISCALSPADIDAQRIAAARVVYLEGYLWDPPLARDALLKAAHATKPTGRTVAFSLSDSFCVDRHRESFLALVRDHVDILFANEHEVMSLYQVDRFEDAVRAAGQDCPLAVLTRSSKGSVIVSAGRVDEINAVAVNSVVDATGAGDLYAAGFLHGFTRGKTLAQCGHMGAVAAAEIIGQIGARPRNGALGDLKAIACA